MQQKIEAILLKHGIQLPSRRASEFKIVLDLDAIDRVKEDIAALIEVDARTREESRRTSIKPPSDFNLPKRD